MISHDFTDLFGLSLIAKVYTVMVAMKLDAMDTSAFQTLAGGFETFHTEPPVTPGKLQPFFNCSGCSFFSCSKACEFAD